MLRQGPGGGLLSWRGSRGWILGGGRWGAVLIGGSLKASTEIDPCIKDCCLLTL